MTVGVTTDPSHDRNAGLRRLRRSRRHLQDPCRLRGIVLANGIFRFGLGEFSIPSDGPHFEEHACTLNILFLGRANSAANFHASRRLKFENIKHEVHLNRPLVTIPLAVCALTLTIKKGCKPKPSSHLSLSKFTYLRTQVSSLAEHSHHLPIAGIDRPGRDPSVH
jgi:hypothetical protein